jgi:selenocysteine-specific elongation factor
VTEEQLTVGVLGHVDHGKTALVKALTGAETDRLEEEKRRGMSIVLGFAYLETERGIVDFIDVPGHEDFVRTMISGATGIDAVLLVVAADEGIKPQTLEHLAIARLLGIKQGLIVVTKSDLADQSMLDKSLDDIRETVQGTFLENGPNYVVSTINGNGIDELIQALANMIAKKQHRSSADNFYLPIDRAFTIDGSGTVGTGTLRNGAIQCEDEVEIMPAGLKANIREIQVHGHKTTEAFPGQRVAVNLRGIKREQLSRGQVLIKPGSIQETSCLHARLRILDDLPRLPKRNEAIRLLFGTEEVLAKMRIVEGGLEASLLEQGASLLVQFRCRAPVVVSTGEHFIARTCSPVMTFGGGEILDTSEGLLQMSKNALAMHLQKLEQADTGGKVIAHIHAAGTQGISLLGLAERSNASMPEVKAVLDKSKAVLIEDTVVVDSQAFEGLCEAAISALEKFHQQNPSDPGQNLDLFRASCVKSCSATIVEYLIKYLGDTEKLVVTGKTIRLFKFDQNDNISSSDRELIDSIEQVYRENGATTPSLDEVTGQDPDKKRAYQYLKESGKLIPLKDQSGKKLLVFHLDTFEGIKRQLSETYPPPSRFTVSDFRVLTDSSRKYVIPILEYFDRNRITIRDGDFRVLTKAAAAANQLR